MDDTTAKKLDELEQSIQIIKGKMESAMNECKDDLESVRSFKEKKLQCDAELRLIKHIKSGFLSEFVVC